MHPPYSRHIEKSLLENRAAPPLQSLIYNWQLGDTLYLNFATQLLGSRLILKVENNNDNSFTLLDVLHMSTDIWTQYFNLVFNIHN